MGFQKAEELRSKNDLTGKNIVVYDLEIKKPVEQCLKGWAGYDEMGISVGCAFDYRVMLFRVFLDDNIKELVDRLNEPGTLIVAFNHIGFDNKLLRGVGLNLKPDEQLNNYDMMRVSKKGSTRNEFVRQKGFRLDDHLQVLGLPMKTGEGVMAPIWWQQGLVGKVIDYCLADVQQEKGLFENMYTTGRTACVAFPNLYSIELPRFS